MPSGQKQQSMEKMVSPRWSLGGSVRKLSSLSLSVEVASLCKTRAGVCDEAQDRPVAMMCFFSVLMEVSRLGSVLSTKNR